MADAGRDGSSSAGRDGSAARHGSAARRSEVRLKMMSKKAVGLGQDPSADGGPNCVHFPCLDGLIVARILR